eukprot:m.22289 g.22289  ORF g.22289 m.22289 type:complete len:284 (+) comp8373_c0_seq1:182-1033(+)
MAATTTPTSASKPQQWLRRVTKDVHLKLMPKQFNDVQKGIRDSVERKLLRYSVDFDGVPVSYSKVRLLSTRGTLFEDEPVAHVHALVTFSVFKPTVGMELIGYVNKITSDHVGILIHDLFNASISRTRLPDGYAYDAGSDSFLHQEIDALAIRCGVYVRFTVEALESSHGVVSIVGSMQQSVDCIASEAEEKAMFAITDTAETDTNSPGGKRKKRVSKAANGASTATTVDGDGDEEVEAGGTDSDAVPAKVAKVAKVEPPIVQAKPEKKHKSKKKKKRKSESK